MSTQSKTPTPELSAIVEKWKHIYYNSNYMSTGDAMEIACLEYAAAVKPCYCLGRNTIERVANESQLETDAVNFVAADDLFHKNPYQQLAALQARIQELEKDKAMLDWLEKDNKINDWIFSTGLTRKWFITEPHVRVHAQGCESLRSAITEAMKK